MIKSLQISGKLYCQRIQPKWVLTLSCAYYTIRRSKKALLVIDKVENLLDEDESKTEALLHTLLSMAPNARLLLASRRLLHLPTVTSAFLSLRKLPNRTCSHDTLHQRSDDDISCRHVGFLTLPCCTRLST